MLTYKGYTGHFVVDIEAGLIFGRLIGIGDVVTFKGTNVAEATQAFRESVDDYLDFLKEFGHHEPHKKFSGNLPFRTTPERHRQIYLAATKAGKSINGWMNEVLAQAL